MEDDYEFLVKLKYGNDVDVNELFGQRVRNGLVTIVVLYFISPKELTTAPLRDIPPISIPI